MMKFSITPLCYFFTESQLRPDTAVTKTFWVSFFWPLYSKHTAALSLSVTLVTLPPVLHWRCNCNFFQQGFLNSYDTKQSFEKFNDDKRKICCSWGSSQERRMYLAAYWGDLRGEEEANKMVFKIHVVHLHTHRSLKWFVILMDE